MVESKADEAIDFVVSCDYGNDTTWKEITEESFNARQACGLKLKG